VLAVLGEAAAGSCRCRAGIDNMTFPFGPTAAAATVTVAEDAPIGAAPVVAAITPGAAVAMANVACASLLSMAKVTSASLRPML